MPVRSKAGDAKIVAEQRAGTATSKASSPLPSGKKSRSRRRPRSSGGGKGARGKGECRGEEGEAGNASSVEVDGRGDKLDQKVGELGDAADGPEAAAAGAEADAVMGKPLEAFVVRVAGCKVRCLLMVDEREERLVVAVGDDLTGEALLASLFEEPAVVQLASHGLMRETAYVNWAAFQVRRFFFLVWRSRYNTLSRNLRTVSIFMFQQEAGHTG